MLSKIFQSKYHSENRIGRYAKNVIAASAIYGFSALVMAQSLTQAESIATVEEILRIDNAAALQKARSEAAKMGVGIAAPVVSTSNAAPVKFDDPLPAILVRSIYGVDQSIKLDLDIDGEKVNGLGVGGLLPGSKCIIARLESACIYLQPASKKVKQSACPLKACWTGNELAAELNPIQVQPVANANNAGSVMPLPKPAAPLPLPVASTGSPSGAPASK